MSQTSTEEAPVNENHDLILAAQAIFADQSNSFKASNGKMVIIKPATMAQVPAVMRFFSAVVNGMDQGALAKLITEIVVKQNAQITAGEDPSKIDLKTLDPEPLVQKAFGNASLLMTLLTATAEELPKLVASFTNLSEAEFGTLNIDEGALLAAGIFTCNYGFFTRSLPPILMAFMKSWASRNPVAVAPQAQAVASRKTVKRHK